MNKKGMEMNFTLLGFVLGVLILIALVVSFVELTKDTNQGFLDKLRNLIPGLNKETTLSSSFDEERIDEGVSFSIFSLLYDSQSGNLRIQKNEAEDGWSLYRITYGGEEYKGPGGITGGIEQEKEFIEKQQILAALLDSTNVRGYIPMKTTIYIHSPGENEGKWFQETEEGDKQYQKGEEVTTETVAQTILADLVEKLT